MKAQFIALILPAQKKSRDWIIWRELPFKAPSLFNISKVAKGISNLYGTSLFEQILVTTHHEDSTGKFNITTIKARERSTELIRFGLRVDNERNIQPSIDIRNEKFIRRWRRNRLADWWRD